MNLTRRRLSLLCAALLSTLALADEPVIRSLGDNRPRQFNELSLPRFRSRQTSRGWEIRTRHATILAPTEQQAETTASHFLKIWQRTQDLVGQWAPNHAGAPFAVGTVQIVVDQRPPRGGRNLPTMTIGDRASILLYVNTTGDGRSLDLQMPRLSLAASRAFFAASGLDRQLPEWVVRGLTAHVVKKELGQDTELQSLFLAKSQRTRQRNNRELNLEQAADRVHFLLRGNDAVNAVRFLELLGKSARTPANVRTNSIQLVSEWRGLIESSKEEFDHWLQNPNAGQPLIKKPSQHSETARAEREMTFLLKLAQRQFSKPRPGIQPRVVVRGVDGFKPIDAGLAKTVPVQRTVRDLRRKALDLEQWATIGPEGNLLFSGTETMKATFDDLVSKYRFRYREERLEVVTLTRPQVSNELTAWLEANPQAPAQPIARFKLAKKN